MDLLHPAISRGGKNMRSLSVVLVLVLMAAFAFSVVGLTQVKENKVIKTATVVYEPDGLMGATGMARMGNHKAIRFTPTEHFRTIGPKKINRLKDKAS